MIKKEPSSSINPGAFKTHPVPSWSRFIKKSMTLLLKAKFDLLSKYVRAEGGNLNNRYFGRGEGFTCSICGYQGYFLNHSNIKSVIWNSICPKCDSRSRHRGLHFIYTEILNQIKEPVKIIHFAPEPIFFSLFKGKQNIKYETADLFLNDVDYKEDIQNLSLPDNEYDIVLCNHVIEHVPDDRSAIKEMARILKPNGKAIITIPGNFDTESTIYFPDLKYNGHYRHYGMEITKTMKEYFKNVDGIDMSIFNTKKDHGIRKFDMAFICTAK